MKRVNTLRTSICVEVRFLKNAIQCEIMQIRTRICTVNNRKLKAIYKNI